MDKKEILEILYLIKDEISEIKAELKELKTELTTDK